MSFSHTYVPPRRNTYTKRYTDYHEIKYTMPILLFSSLLSGCIVIVPHRVRRPSQKLEKGARQTYIVPVKLFARLVFSSSTPKFGEGGVWMEWH